MTHVQVSISIAVFMSKAICDIIVLHCVHGNIPGMTKTLAITQEGNKVINRLRASTYKNVPPENKRRTPVHHFMDSSASGPFPAPPNILTTNHVPNAPIGAARLKISKWALAALFPRPCLRRTLVKPNAAGALCTIIATKMMKDKEGWLEDAPSAMPSAVACITSPRVVDNVPLGREGVEGDGEDVEERSEREYMLWVRWDGWAGASDGIMSIRYMSINPRIKEMPIQACGV